MNYLSVEQVSKHLGGRMLFENLRFGLEKGDKVALIARNGQGKSTLLRIIAGKEKADTGKSVLRKDITVGFLDQDPEFSEHETVLENVLRGNAPGIQVVREYEYWTDKLHADPEHAEALQQINHLIPQMDSLNVWDLETRVQQILGRFKIQDLGQKVKELSGGQRKRVALCRLLIEEPDLILLDEPTNHLDIEMTEWLEEWLSRPGITFLLVTHDRYFLDDICTRILELENKTLYDHVGNYSKYLEAKAEREISEQASIDKASNLYRKELEWMRRMPKARTTKSKARIDSFHDLKQKAFSGTTQDKLELTMKMSRMGGHILEFQKVSHAFGDKIILKDFSYTFRKGERTGIAGPNGVGKTTFLNLILEKLKPDAGMISRGETIRFGYYTQEGIQIAQDKRVLEVVKDVAEFIELADGNQISALQMLNRFLFLDDMPYAFVHKLSGGEKRRLSLLMILMRNPNFLILDEPTNDLDLETLSVLESFLLNFKGCLLIVSHDRYFLDKLTEHLLVFEGEGVITHFTGAYSEFRYMRKEEEKAAKLKERAGNKPLELLVQKAVPEKSVKLSYKEQKELENLEAEIKQLENKKELLEQSLAKQTEDFTEIQKLSVEIQTVINLLETCTERWLELEEKRMLQEETSSQ